MAVDVCLISGLTSSLGPSSSSLAIGLAQLHGRMEDFAPTLANPQ